MIVRGQTDYKGRHASSAPSAALLSMAALLAVATAACDAGPKSGRGFTLPEGDAARGEEVFVQLQCTDCHSVADRDDLREGVVPVLNVQLGGKTPRIATYGELVTSVINPSHRIAQRASGQPVETPEGESLMRNYNDVMTVAELIDLVAFLQDQYELEPVSPTQYPPYYGP